MTIAELNALSDSYDVEMRAIKAKKVALATVRACKLAEDQADEWGLTVEEYATVKREANPAGAAQSALDAVERQAIKLAQRAADPRKPKDVREKAAAELANLEAKIPSLAKAVIDAQGKRMPLHKALNAARKRKAKAARNAQTAQAQVAAVGAAAKNV